MALPLFISKKHIKRLFLWPKPNLSKLCLIEKQAIALWMFYIGIAIVFFSSLTPWFLWPIQRYYMPIGFVPVSLSMLMSLHLREPIFSRKDYLFPTMSMGLLLLMMALSSGRNINGIFMVFFSTFVYFAFFKLNIPNLRKLSDFLTSVLACILLISIPMFILHLLGFPLPRTQANLGDYRFDNYLFFLIDHRSNWELIPRFHSVCV